MPNLVIDIGDIEGRIWKISPMGYVLAINAQARAPEYFKITYPALWAWNYHTRAYAEFDPAILWCHLNVGSIRWSQIDLHTLSRAGDFVRDEAKQFGLNFGGSASTRKGGREHSSGALIGARSDREFTSDELDELLDILDTIVDAVPSKSGLSALELQTLHDLASGLTHRNIADLRGINAATVKKRLERARLALGARNAVQAVAVAASLGLIPRVLML